MSIALGFALSVLFFLVIMILFLGFVLHGQIQILDDRIHSVEIDQAMNRHPAGKKKP